MSDQLGPWRRCTASGGGCQCGLVWDEPGDIVIAQIVLSDDDHTKEEGYYQRCWRLVAAAPELLEALLQVCEYAEQFCDAGDHLYQTRKARQLIASIGDGP